jgi:hypothetical protein
MVRFSIRPAAGCPCRKKWPQAVHSAASGNKRAAGFTETAARLIGQNRKHLLVASFKHISKNTAPRVRRLLALRHAGALTPITT